MNYHRTNSVKRLQVLLLIASLALLVVCILGLALTLSNLQYQFQANSVRHKRVLSINFIGLQMVDETRIMLSNETLKEAWLYLHVLLQQHQG